MKIAACVIGVVVGLGIAFGQTYRPQSAPVIQSTGGGYQSPVQYARWGSLPGYPPSGGYCLDVAPTR